MSKSRKHSHRRQPSRGRITRATAVATQIAVVDDRDPESIELAKRTAHDQLIEGLGARRRSGVRWYIFDNDDPAALQAVEALERSGIHSERWRSDPPAHPDATFRFGEGSRAEQYEQTIGWIKEHPEGALIIATADGSIR